jgi:trehalose 6-phosphate phosphatase
LAEIPKGGGIPLTGQPPLAAVIFDLDGVITFTASMHAASWKRMFDEFLKSRSEATGEPFVPFDIDHDYLTYVDGMPRIEGVKSFLASRGIKLPDGTPEDSPGVGTAWALGNRKNEVFTEVLDSEGVEVDEASVSFIRKLLERGVRVAVASSSKNCLPILERAGLVDLFAARVDGVVSEEIGLAGKPNPDIFLEAAKRLGVEPGDSIVVEDAISGVQAGRAGRFGLVIGIDRGGVARGLRENGADLILEGFDGDSLDLVTAWFENRHQRLASALTEWAAIEAQLAGKRLALFLDYDGTLSPIVSRPELAVLTKEQRKILKQVAGTFPTAIISGRGRDDIQRLVGLGELAFAGSHGFDIVGPGGISVGHQVADWVEPVMSAVAEQLAKAVDGIEGALLEPKRFSVAVHYRLVPESEIHRVEASVDAIVDTDERLRKAHGKKVFEIRPGIDWDKGKALLFLLDALGLDLDDVVPLYIGDDVTDEDAFDVLVDRGIGILVSDAPRSTRASYWLQAPSEVYGLFERLLEWEATGR